jgi:hypothetical protein
VVTPGMVPPYPTLASVLSATHLTPSTLQLSDAATVNGHHLAGTQRAVFLRNDHFGIDRRIDIPDGDDEAAFAFTVPNLPADLPVGLYQMQLRVLRDSATDPSFSNVLPVALAPAITTFPPTVMTRGTVDGVPNVLRLRIGCRPQVRAGQKVTLLMDTREVRAQPFTGNVATLDFRFPDAPPAGGTPLLRLKVDDIESVVIDRGAKPPAFFNHRITLPA